MCAFKLTDPGLPGKILDAFESDNDNDKPVRDKHGAMLVCSGKPHDTGQFQELLQSHIITVSQLPRLSIKFQPWLASLRRTGQPPDLLPDMQQALALVG